MNWLSRWWLELIGRIPQDVTAEEEYVDRRAEALATLEEMRSARQFAPGKVRGRDYAPVDEPWERDTRVRYEG